MTNFELESLFKKVLNASVLSTKDSSNGVDQEVTIVTSDKGTFVVKKPRRDSDKNKKEEIATTLCAEKGIPAPKVLYTDEKILIETYIEGSNLQTHAADKETTTKIYKEIGQLLKKMHTITCQGFGSITEANLICPHPTQKDAIDDWIHYEIDKLGKTNLYSKEEMLQITTFYEENRHCLDESRSVLLHWDITDDNIIIKDNTVAAFIDFGDITAGSPMQDFAFPYIYHFGTYKFDAIMEGYGKHDMQKIEFFAFCWMCWRLGSRANHKQFGQTFEDMKALFGNIWKK
jgi:aminoglycoside phosphotransferase (APT) family kinase protein